MSFDYRNGKGTVTAGEFNGENFVRGGENINWGKVGTSGTGARSGKSRSGEQAESAAHSSLRLPNASLTS